MARDSQQNIDDDRNAREARLEASRRARQERTGGPQGNLADNTFSNRPPLTPPTDVVVPEPEPAPEPPGDFAEVNPALDLVFIALDRIGEVEAQLAHLADQGGAASAGDVNEMTGESDLWHPYTIIEPGTETPLVVGAASAGTVITAGVGGGSFNLDAVDVETNPAIIDVDLADDKIVVKAGHSGVYRLVLYCKCALTATSAGLQWGAAYFERVSDSVTVLTWSLSQNASNVTGSGNVTGMESSSVRDIFIDAAGADAGFELKYNMTTPYGSGTLELKSCSITLIVKTNAAYAT